MKKEKQSTKKGAKIVVWTFGALSALLCIFVVLYSIMAIGHRRNGYNDIFGYSWINVETDRFAQGSGDKFNEGDRGIFKLSKTASARENISKETLVLYKFNDSVYYGRVYTTAEGGKSYTITNQFSQNSTVSAEHILGVYSSKVEGGGSLIAFMFGNKGYVVFVLLPLIAILAYLITIFVASYVQYSRQDEATLKAVPLTHAGAEGEALIGTESDSYEEFVSEETAEIYETAEINEDIIPPELLIPEPHTTNKFVVIAPEATETAQITEETAEETIKEEKAQILDLEPNADTQPLSAPTATKQAKPKATAKSATAKPATAKPATAKSTTAKPSTAKVTAEKPTATKSATTKSATVKSTTAKPATSKTPTVKATAEKPATAKPATPKTAVAKSPTTKPKAPKPPAPQKVEENEGEWEKIDT
ncbi:MAG: hypothetical protein FWD49_01440 [Firmicutes bacterium]|nr:hypothetical protein [Bacillota bacterium]